MRRLDEIEARYQRNHNYMSDLTDDHMGWLIARVRELETALRFYALLATYQGEWDVCPIWNDLGVKATEALKED